MSKNFAGNKGKGKNNGFCWICLDESHMNSLWLRHDCGCNLQIHKLCYYRLLYDLNKTEIRDNYDTILDFDDINDSLRRRVCYIMDGHRDFHRQCHPGEIIGTAFLYGKSLMKALYISPTSILSGNDETFSFCSTPKLSNYLLVEHAKCPQCKKLIIQSNIPYTSESSTLSIYYGLRKVVRLASTLGVLALSILNYEKWSFKLGLMQLRSIFPEKVLRVLLDVSTTRCLDVFAETKNGRESVSRMTHLIILGFPLFMASFKDQSYLLNIFEIGYSVILGVRSSYCEGGTKGITSKTISLTNMFILFYTSFVNPAFSSIYEFMVKSLRPYFCLTGEKMDLFPTREYSDVIIRVEWYDIVVESIVWPFLGNKVGGFMYNQLFRVLSRLKVRWMDSGSPDECRMIFNIIGCGTVAIARQLLNLHLTYLRIRELKEIQAAVNDISFD